jgi:hypothetical protein
MTHGQRLLVNLLPALVLRKAPHTGARVASTAFDATGTGRVCGYLVPSRAVAAFRSVHAIEVMQLLSNLVRVQSRVAGASGRR